MGSPGRSRAASAGALEFEVFFRAVLPRAITAGERVCGERAGGEDAAVAALAKAHRSWARLRDQPWREAWVLRVTVNEAIDGLPRRFPLPAVPDQRDPSEEVVLRLALRAALRGLPRRQRQVIALRYLVGLSEPEVALALQISHGSVKTHLRRGLHVLRRSLGPQLEEKNLAELT